MTIQFVAESGLRVFYRWASSRRLQHLALILFGLALLAPRLTSLDISSGRYLWAEDGNVFLADATGAGIKSLVKPYAGYLHAYPRLVALLASKFPLEQRPLVLFGGWCAAYTLLVALIVRKANASGASAAAIAAALVAISLQPNNGEVFFNLTNSQWLLGAALALLSLAASGTATGWSRFELPVIAVLGLTGPFSIVLAPFAILRAALLRDWRERLPAYLLLVCTAAAQLTVLLKSGRADPSGASSAIWIWFLTFWQIAFFGANDWYAFLAAGGFWALLLSGLIRMRVLSDRRDIFISALLIVLWAVLLVVVSEYSQKADPKSIAWLGSGNRYSWVPYSLLFFSAAIVAVRLEWWRQLLLATFCFYICWSSFKQAPRSDVQFAAHAKYARYRSLDIPIHPQIEAYPGWHVQVDGITRRSLPGGAEHQISLDTLRVVGSTGGKMSPDGYEVVGGEGGAEVAFPSNAICAKPSVVGVEISMRRSVDGWAELAWHHGDGSTTTGSLRRWFPAGLVRVQFAFNDPVGGAQLKFRPIGGLGTMQISSAVVYCVPN